MNDFNINRYCPKFFCVSVQKPSTYLYFLSAFLSFAAFFQQTLQLNASELNHVPNQIIIKYKDPSFSPLAKDSKDSNQDNSDNESADYKYTAVFPERMDVVLVEGEGIQQLVKKLKTDPNIEYFEPHYYKKVYEIKVQRNDLPNDNDFNKQWALNNSSSDSGADLDFLEALALSRESTPDDPVIIGIVDSTFDIKHPDLINQLWVNKEEIPYNGIDDDNNGYIDDIHGFDFVNLTPYVKGEDDHGSHVAGICAAEKNNRKGISGAFPNVKFIALACSSGGDYISSIAALQAIDYLIKLKNRGYNIVAINASFGSYIYSQLGYDAVEDLSNNGILLCAAAGNDGWNLDLEKDNNGNGVLDIEEDLNGNGILDASYPSGYDLPNIISVASINSNLELAVNSNYGQKEVDIGAPGVDIYSTINLDYILENQEILLSNGTSIANQLIENTSSILDSSLSGQLINCGIGDLGQFPSEVNGNIALIERGNLLFSEKVNNAMNAGAIATIIYNNVEESEDGLRPWLVDSALNLPWIPSFSISQADGQTMLQSLPLTATLRPFTTTIDPTSDQYAYLSGTSMASPFVTAAVAFAAHNFPNETAAQRRARILKINSIASVIKLLQVAWLIYAKSSILMKTPARLVGDRSFQYIK